MGASAPARAALTIASATSSAPKYMLERRAMAAPGARVGSGRLGFRVWAARSSEMIWALPHLWGELAACLEAGVRL